MKRIGVLTSGGDAPGMNAALRAVVRTGLNSGLEVFAIYEGYSGMVEGGERIRPLSWGDVGGILHLGGTIIGSARCSEFRERPGRLRAVRNLLLHEIEGLIVIGGDGSLTGAALLHHEWNGLVQELFDSGQITKKAASRARGLPVVGIIGSIDNDMFGSDITTGADTALHRIVDATDAISSTAASHQRSFVVEVMGRNCGYLALMGAMASGADWVLIPEAPPDVDDWEAKMCEMLQKGRRMGRRDSMVIVAEGARDRNGKPITTRHIKEVLEERLNEDVRITVLGHVQRGGSPSAFDRNLSTLLGVEAIEAIATMSVDDAPLVVGMQGNEITRTPLLIALEKTKAVADAVAAKRFDEALALRGRTFSRSFNVVRTLVRASPHPPAPDQRRLRIAIVHGGGPAPGMNTAARAAVRIGIDRGHIMLGVHNAFRGLINNEIEELSWMSVNGWATRGGSELGTNRSIPVGRDLYAIARTLEEKQIDGILMIGGWSGYQGVLQLYGQRKNYPAFDIPMICLPATINNNLPGTELSVGADTALNSIISAVDKIKQSAVASQRAFIVEVMGYYCGYLALMGALATGAERVYLHEEGVSMNDLVADVEEFRSAFERGKRLGLIIRNEMANEVYTTNFMRLLFEEEGGDLFDVRQAILGHMQQGGSPSPFDRIFATRLGVNCIDFLEDHITRHIIAGACIGQIRGEIEYTDLDDIARLMDYEHSRPLRQWWMDLRPIARILAHQNATVPGAGQTVSS
ncbi:MAG: 6-phosphofructokinase [Anaerolineae bacterium]|uniref:6-phosphofructokinase n=1 Tax=Promineifilum sp. TaxID=2664178 RepID=UPI001DD2C799|nr:6-phosphofructokinase [Anaerolineales bacterium]MCB8934138.1 6-phosphofructokinase [Promineifilum sp.]MCO5179760.1 6-phosphofructokinase [Promineifilum sp.]MCW5845680.1 6-phosphofructokinase [Anaerolineae bacterium]